MMASLVMSAVRKMMYYPRHRLFEVIAQIKYGNSWRHIAPATPMTEAGFEAFHSFCRMWSSMWGCEQHNLLTAKRKGYEETNHVRRSK
jgi:hypothetical protein